MGKSLRELSELECFTLGLVWQMGSCTPYQIRQQMLDSPSTEWSGSAGAVYPLIQRLKKRGLLHVTSGATGRRRHKTYSIAPAGLKMLREWIGPPIADTAKTVAHDPLRSRVRFLGALNRQQQIAWLHSSLDALEEVAAKVRQWQSQHADSDEFLQFVARSGELDVQLRRKWLKELLGQRDRSDTARE
jgi:DNA-binding PadR family transcriptional regulator